MNFVDGVKYIKAEFPKHKIAISIALFFLFLAIFGFVFNNLQNPNKILTSEWLYDVFALSWTNLLAIPIFLILAPWGNKPRDWTPLREVLREFLLSPIYWIGLTIVIRLLAKFSVLFDKVVSDFLQWLAS